MSESSKIHSEFAAKYRLYGDMLYKLSMVYMNNKMDCEDIMQDVFIKLIYKSPEFKSREHEKHWLIRVCINLCKDRLKESWNRKREQLIENTLSVSNEGSHYLKEAIENLPLKLKAPIHLYYFEGYRTEEIANILKIGKSAVKMRLKRGRDFLRLELE